jgi:nucleotide-binding universal stress UspA family protein
VRLLVLKILHMKKFEVKKILVPTDFSETGLLAIDHAAHMAKLFSAQLILLHVIEVAETTFDIYNPSAPVRSISDLQVIVTQRLSDLAGKIRNEHGITPEILCSSGRTAHEIADIAAEKEADLIIMGTHGASGFEEFFIGSNAHKTVTIAPCPVITVQTHVKTPGFREIVLPIDDTLHSRQKVDTAVELAKKYGSRIHIVGLMPSSDTVDKNKFGIKLDAVEDAVKRANVPYVRKTFEERNVAAKAMDYSNYVNADLIVIMTDHESHLTGMFIGPFAKQIVNHSRIPVMSIRPVEGRYESIDLTGVASPY